MAAVIDPLDDTSSSSTVSRGGRVCLDRVAKRNTSYREPDTGTYSRASENGGPAIDAVLGHCHKEGVDWVWCKLKGMSYRKTRWIPVDEATELPGERKVSVYLRGWDLTRPFPDGPPTVAMGKGDSTRFDPAYLQVDRIIARRRLGTQMACLVLWVQLGYGGATWELESDLKDEGALAALERFHSANQAPLAEPPMRMSAPAEFNRVWVDALMSRLTFRPNTTLRGYQAEGAGWLVWSWLHKRGVILADEMGLGKTAQTLIFIMFLVRVLRRSGPYLVVAPVTTLKQWIIEARRWTDLDLLLYYGNRHIRALQRKYEWTFPEEPSRGTPRAVAPDYKFHVLVTSYELAVRDPNVQRLQVECFVLDEGHRVRNKDSSTFQVLATIPAAHRVILSGTPVHNRPEELWWLLKFLNPDTPPSPDMLEGGIPTGERLIEWRKSCAPYILRRTKEEVAGHIPQKSEIMLRVGLTSHQKVHYKAIVEQKRAFLSDHGKHRLILSNLVMQLRKVCCHPFLLEGAESRIRSMEPTEDGRDTLLVRSAGKLILLDKLLVRLKVTGRRVLVFSQLVIMLNIMEEYVISRGWRYERLDGTTPGDARQSAIDRFQDEGEDVFVFLLSTRAGGFGINLTRADTVIIYDSDWNPQMDAQAQARCHRIGQNKDVVVYRLVAKGTIEERVLDVASRKLGLEHAMLSCETNGMSSEDLDSLLRRGVYELYLEHDGGVEDDTKLLEADLDSILASATRTTPSKHSWLGSVQYSAAEYCHGEADNPNHDGIDFDDEDFWTKLLPAPVTPDRLARELPKAPGPAQAQEYIHNVWTLITCVLDAEGGQRAFDPQIITDRLTLEKLLHQLLEHPAFVSYRDTVEEWLPFLTAKRLRSSSPLPPTSPTPPSPRPPSSPRGRRSTKRRKLCHPESPPEE